MTARKADNLHLLNSTYRKDRHGDPDAKPKVEIKIPSPPNWLEGNALAEWKRICKVLKNSGLLSSAETAVLSQYCLLYGQLQDSVVYADDESKRFNAAQHTQLRLCCVELGLTPKARSQITVGKKKDANAFDDI